jgi:hypothetical protein
MSDPAGGSPPRLLPQRPLLLRAAAPAAPAAAPAAAAPAPASVLASGAASAPSGSPAAAPSAEEPHAWVPEKHRVFGEDGKTLNIEASARKVAEAHGHLEKRLGSGDVPPKTAAEYKVNVPEALADKIKADDLAKADTFKSFLDKAHAAGMSQKQVDVMVGDFLERSMALQSGVKQLTEQEASAKLRETWKTDAEFKAGVEQAFRAGKAYAGADFDGILDDYGNDPRIVRMLAAVGKELAEDTSAPAGAQAGNQADVESLTKSKAYMDASHPDHLATKQKVQR